MEAITLIKEDGEEDIPRSTVRGTEKLPKITRINRGEGADSDRTAIFCAASKGDSASENNESDSPLRNQQGRLR